MTLALECATAHILHKGDLVRMKKPTDQGKYPFYVVVSLQVCGDWDVCTIRPFGRTMVGVEPVHGCASKFKYVQQPACTVSKKDIVRI